MIRQQSPLAAYSLCLISLLGSKKILPLNHKLKQLSSAGHFDKVLALYHHLRLSDTKPDGFTFPYVLKACAATQDSGAGQLVHSHVIRSGHIYSMSSNHVSWNLIVSEYGTNGCPEVALELVNLMRRQGLGLDAVGLKIVVPLCAQLHCEPPLRRTLCAANPLRGEPSARRTPSAAANPLRCEPPPL
ncbi:hypothetical protein Taro_056376 [Colocasia esculenta]|uniref:Pentatricopeptide repeat-containing protein n=1 Tax=Colocasia esculenta TaxID=4460 RepID=A0A843XW53_COLES|nr:hypothetical protein [Colocasia esculenta]